MSARSLPLRALVLLVTTLASVTPPADAGRLKPAVGSRPLLVLCWDPKRPDHPAPPAMDIEQKIFGATNSVRDYFRENSQGRFDLVKAGFFAWQQARYPWQLYWRVSPYSPADAKGTKHEYVESNGTARYLDDDGFIGGHSHKWAESIRLADPHFDYSKYDKNGDRVISPDELVILMVIPQKGGFGTRRGVVGRHVPKEEPLIVDGVRIVEIVEAYMDGGDHLGLLAHELAHGLFDTPDIYFECNGQGFAHPYGARSFSLMAKHWEHPHLDPAEKAWLGWVDPMPVTKSGPLVLHDVETTGQVFRLPRPGYGDREYFLLENRHPGSSYDSKLPDRGLAIWHVIEDDGLSQNLVDRAGVDEKMLPCIWGQWARRAIRLIRPIRGSSDDARSLRDGSDPVTGKDVLAVPKNAFDVILRWADGTPSGYEITQLSKAGPSMTFHLQVPERLRLRSVVNGKIVRGGVGSESLLAAVSDHAKGWETFHVLPLGGSRVALMSDVSGLVVRAGVGQGTLLAAVSTAVRGWETFEKIDLGGGRIALRSVQNGKYVRAGIGQGTLLAAVSDRIAGWETFETVGDGAATITGLKPVTMTVLPPANDAKAANPGSSGSSPTPVPMTGPTAPSPASPQVSMPAPTPVPTSPQVSPPVPTPTIPSPLPTLNPNTPPPPMVQFGPVRLTHEFVGDAGGKDKFTIDVRAGDRIVGTVTPSAKAAKAKKKKALSLVVKTPDGKKKEYDLGAAANIDLRVGQDGRVVLVVDGLGGKRTANASLSLERR